MAIEEGWAYSPYFFSPCVFVYYYYCSKLLQILWLRATEIYYLTVLDVKILK